MNNQQQPAYQVLQFNQSGAWRTVLTFDGNNMPGEFLQSADMLLRLAGAKGRIVAGVSSDNGSIVASSIGIKNWAIATGWVDA